MRLNSRMNKRKIRKIKDKNGGIDKKNEVNRFVKRVRKMNQRNNFIAPKIQLKS